MGLRRKGVGEENYGGKRIRRKGGKSKLKQKKKEAIPERLSNRKH